MQYVMIISDSIIVCIKHRLLKSCIFVQAKAKPAAKNWGNWLSTSLQNLHLHRFSLYLIISAHHCHEACVLKSWMLSWMLCWAQWN